MKFLKKIILKPICAKWNKLKSAISAPSRPTDLVDRSSSLQESFNKNPKPNRESNEYSSFSFDPISGPSHSQSDPITYSSFNETAEINDSVLTVPELETSYQISQLGEIVDYTQNSNPSLPPFVAAARAFVEKETPFVTPFLMPRKRRPLVAGRRLRSRITKAAKNWNKAVDQFQRRNPTTEHSIVRVTRNSQKT
ncbi:unnamed protein product, partial [Mesorhabditis belari]|uniref:Uncharacterized protein n=1 Tax=Mesorhabditis belari TaxID=2138241 RepID=A0AAF3EK34_9BILA